MIFHIESRHIKNKNKTTLETKGMDFHCISVRCTDRRDIYIGAKNIAVAISVRGGCHMLPGYGTVSGCGEL